MSTFGVILLFPGSLEVGKLKLLCQRLFKVPAARQALFLKAGGENPMPDNIGEDDSKDLMFFSVEVSPCLLCACGLTHVRFSSAACMKVMSCSFSVEVCVYSVLVNLSHTIQALLICIRFTTLQECKKCITRLHPWQCRAATMLRCLQLLLQAATPSRR